jgi:hypothetical protein
MCSKGLTASVRNLGWRRGGQRGARAGCLRWLSDGEQGSGLG